MHVYVLLKKLHLLEFRASTVSNKQARWVRVFLLKKLNCFITRPGRFVLVGWHVHKGHFQRLQGALSSLPTEPRLRFYAPQLWWKSKLLLWVCKSVQSQNRALLGHGLGGFEGSGHWTEVCHSRFFSAISPICIDCNNNILYFCKDFLQNIEGSLFSSSLYDKWLAIPCQGKREDEKITATRR